MFATSFAIVSATVFAIAFVLANVTALASEPVLLVTEADCTQNRAAHPMMIIVKILVKDGIFRSFGYIRI